jgi:hypothetical protein
MSRNNPFNIHARELIEEENKYSAQAYELAISDDEKFLQENVNQILNPPSPTVTRTTPIGNRRVQMNPLPDSPQEQNLPPTLPLSRQLTPDEDGTPIPRINDDDDEDAEIQFEEIIRRRLN